MSGYAMGRTSPALLVLPAVFLVEVILGGPLGIYGGVPIRHLLFWICAAVLGIAWMVHGRIARAHIPAVFSIAGFIMVNAAWTTIVPSLAGGRLGYAFSEARAFAVLGLAILVLGIIGAGDLRPLVRRLQVLVVMTSALLALAQIAIWIVGTMFSDLQWVIRLGLVGLYDGAENALYVGPMPDGFFRVFWISSLWLLLAMFWVSAIQRRSMRVLLRLVLMVGLFVTYSRGMWLGALVGLGVAQMARLTMANFPRLMMRATGAIAVVIGLLFGALAATGELERTATRLTSTTSTEDPSIGVRLEQAHHLSQVWAEHELFGNGYGAYHPRYGGASAAPFSYENMPYAFLAKLGLIGVLVNGAFLAFWSATAWRARKRDPEAAASFLGGLGAFLIATMTNPMIINMVGMSMLVCLLIQWASLREPLEEADVA